MAKWSRLAPAADRRLVKSLLDGDDAALATLYDGYAERLYDYCVALVGDRDDAAGIVHDTFIDAARRTPRMRERERLRAWLYAGVRRRCLRREQPAVMAGEETLARLGFAEREALFLAYRHDLTGDDLAATLGISPRRAQSRLRHAERLVPQARKLLGTASAPELPGGLRHRVLHAGSDPELARYRAEIAARGGTLTDTGMPRQPDAPSRLARRWAVASSVSITALATAFAALVITRPELPAPDWPGPSEHDRRSPDRHPSEPHRTPGTQAPTAAARVLPPPPAHRRGGGRAVAGTLTVSPPSIHFLGDESTADLRLAAKGGEVSWTAMTPSPRLTLSDGQGRMPAGGHATVRITLERGLLTLPGTTTVTLVAGADRFVVPVSWDLSLL